MIFSRIFQSTVWFWNLLRIITGKRQFTETRNVSIERFLLGVSMSKWLLSLKFSIFDMIKKKKKLDWKRSEFKTEEIRKLTRKSLYYVLKIHLHRSMQCFVVCVNKILSV